MRTSLVASCLALTIVAATVAQTHLRVGVAAGNETLEPLIAAAYHEMGCEADFVVVPADRSLASADSGALDADLGRVEGAVAGYPNLIMTKEPFLIVKLRAVVADTFPGTKLEPKDLAELRILYLRGAKFAPQFLATQNLKGEAVSDVRSLARMLKAGRGDVGLLTTATPLRQADDEAQGLHTLAKALATIPAFHVLNKSHANLVARFDAAIRALRVSGRLAQLLSGFD